MKKVSDFLVSHMAVLVVICGALGALAPATMSWISPYINIGLGVIMFGMGMTLTFDDFRRVLKAPWQCLLGAACQFTIMPLTAFGLCKLFQLPPELAIGVILVGTCPGGTASNVLSFIAKGDVALSVSMTMVSTILAPVLTPALTLLLAGQYVQVSFMSMMMSIVKMVLVPVLLGLFLHQFFGKTTEKITPVMPLLSSVTIALIVGAVVSLSAEKLFDYGISMAAVCMLHNLLGLMLGYAVARLFRLNPEQARTVSIEVGTQNSGLAASLGVMYFTAAAGIAGGIFSVVQNVFGSIAANLFLRAEEKRSSAETDGAKTV